MDDNTNTIAHLKATLNAEIKIQTEVKDLFKRILRRIAYISVVLTISILSGLFFIIYTLSEPHSLLRKLENTVIENRLILKQNIVEIQKLKEQVIYEKSKHN